MCADFVAVEDMDETEIAQQVALVPHCLAHPAGPRAAWSRQPRTDVLFEFQPPSVKADTPAADCA